MPLIVIPDDAPPVLSRSDAIAQLRDCEHRLYPTLPADSRELVARIAGADAVINIRASTRFTADVLAGCPRLRLISIWGTGTDHVDLEAAKARGIVVTNTPAVSAVAVAGCMPLVAPPLVFSPTTRPPDSPLDLAASRAPPLA